MNIGDWLYVYTSFSDEVKANVFTAAKKKEDD